MGCNVSKEHQLENASESGDGEQQQSNGGKESKGSSAKSKKSGGSKAGAKDQAMVQSEVNCVVTAPDSEPNQGDNDTKGEGTRQNGDANDQVGEQQVEEEDMEIDPNDPQMNAAAAKIQASFRGHKVRKELKKTADEIDLMPTPREEREAAAAAAAEAASAAPRAGEEEEVDIDLTDPDVEKAATKIQASFRGYRVRKTRDGSTSPTEENPGS